MLSYHVTQWLSSQLPTNFISSSYSRVLPAPAVTVSCFVFSTHFYCASPSLQALLPFFILSLKQNSPKQNSSSLLHTIFPTSWRPFSFLSSWRVVGYIAIQFQAIFPHSFSLIHLYHIDFSTRYSHDFSYFLTLLFSQIILNTKNDSLKSFCRTKSNLYFGMLNLLLECGVVRKWRQ